MQKFYPLNMQDYVNVAVPKMQKSIESAASNFSGNAFPTENLQVGMTCMRTDDENKLYKLTSLKPITWVLVDDSVARIDAHNTNIDAHSDFKGTTTTENGVRGMVPAPMKNQAGCYLNANGLWMPIPTMQGATATAAGTSGLIPAPEMGAQKSFLRGDGLWSRIADFLGASATTLGQHGLVPAPDKGQQDKYLKGDGTWGDIPKLTPHTMWDTFHAYGENYVPADTSNQGWNALGVCSIYYNENLIKNQPTQYGQLINIPADNQQESTQLWIDQIEGRIYSRKGNVSITVNDQPFRESSGSGIVAQSLAQNGWGKFSNGLIIQWIRDDGDHNEHSEVTFNFPIAFSTCFWAGALGWANNRYGGSYQSGGVKWFNNTQFAHIGADNGSCSMIVLAFGIA